MTWDSRRTTFTSAGAANPTSRRSCARSTASSSPPAITSRVSPELRDDGSTASGAWIYSGYFPAPGENLTRQRKGDAWVSPEWAWAWPMNRRNLYNRASADPSGKPWSERKKLVWWDAEAKKWTGYDVPDFPVGKPPDAKGDPEATGLDAHDGTAPFIMQEFGVAEIFGVQGTVDGPFPTHYEPMESPIVNPLYPGTQVNPTLKEWRRDDNPYHGVGDSEHPYVVTTYRLTEHHLSGAMTRWLPWLAELQPELFCELSPELAVTKGIRNGEWMTVSTARGEIELKALVTGRMAPLRLGRGRYVHPVGIPMHFGFQGVVTGDTPNLLPPLVADPNVSIHRGQGVHLQHPPRAALVVPRGRDPARRPRPANGRRSGVRSGRAR